MNSLHRPGLGGQEREVGIADRLPFGKGGDGVAQVGAANALEVEVDDGNLGRALRDHDGPARLALPRIAANYVAERGLLGHGAGRLVLDFSQRKGVTVREAGVALLEGRLWEELGG
jgi:hypothetical protein